MQILTLDNGVEHQKKIKRPVPGMVETMTTDLTKLYVSYILCKETLQKAMTVTTNDRGQQNLFAKEPRMYVSQTDAERYGYESYAERAEKLNGRTAMLGFVAGLLSYAITGNLFFGLL